VNRNVADVSVVATTVRSLTAPGCPGLVDTVATAESVRPALTTLIVSLPGATGVPVPVVSTCMTDGLWLFQSTRRFVRIFPEASFNVTTKCDNCPVETLTCAGVTVTDAIAGAPPTASVATPAMPFPAVAWIVAVPIPTLLASPLLEIATMVESLLVHLTA
jgi:hypothetical protein